MFGRRKYANYEETTKVVESEEDKETEHEDEPEEEGFDFVKETKGMTEKQLLKLLVVMKWDKEYEEVSESWEGLIKIVKEE